MGKKIALICNTYIRNYGSILQSLATFKKISSLGYEVEVINYKDNPDRKAKLEIIYHLKLPLLTDPTFLKKKFKNSISAIGNHEYKRIVADRNTIMDLFVNKHFIFSKKCNNINEVKNIIKDYNAVIIGSDQLWGPADIIRDYHTLNFVPEKILKIAYATSFGVSKLPKFLNKRTANFLRKINYLSVREDSGAKIIESLINLKVQVVADPTLLLTQDEWNQYIDNNPRIQGKYIFCFFLGDNEEQRNFAKEVSKKMKMPIVSIQHMDEFIKSATNFADINVNDASPSDFINLIKYAELILCDSFHASIFSIIYSKKFFTFNRYNSSSPNARNSRIDTLSNKLDLSNRHLIQINTLNIEQQLSSEINYQKVHTKLNAWKEESLNYLKNSLLNI